MWSEKSFREDVLASVLGLEDHVGKNLNLQKTKTILQPSPVAFTGTLAIVVL